MRRWCLTFGREGALCTGEATGTLGVSGVTLVGINQGVLGGGSAEVRVARHR